MILLNCEFLFTVKEIELKKHIFFLWILYFFILFLYFYLFFFAN